MSQEKNNARMYDVNSLIAAGIDPKTHLPIAFNNVDGSCISKGDIKKQLRIVDEQDAVNRFKWFNLPRGLNAKLIERILYYRGQGMFFKLKNKFYFLPYTLDGTIDIYGRFMAITPLPFNGTSNDGKKETPWIQGLTFKPVYDILTPEDFENASVEEIVNFINESCVILKDYTEQYSQTNISRQILNDPILDIMSECFPFMRTSLLNATGVMGMRVNTENEQQNVYAASNAINKAALTGHKYIPVIGNVDFQEMTGGNVGKAEEFLVAMQSLDNYRLSLYGLENGGLFQKKAHMLQDEQDMRSNTSSLVMEDSLKCRQDFCNIVNSIWNIGIWCDINETALEKEDKYFEEDDELTENSNEESEDKTNE